MFTRKLSLEIHNSWYIRKEDNELLQKLHWNQHRKSKFDFFGAVTVLFSAGSYWVWVLHFILIAAGFWLQNLIFLSVSLLIPLILFYLGSQVSNNFLKSHDLYQICCTELPIVKSNSGGEIDILELPANTYELSKTITQDSDGFNFSDHLTVCVYSEPLLYLLSRYQAVELLVMVNPNVDMLICLGYRAIKDVNNHQVKRPTEIELNALNEVCRKVGMPFYILQHYILPVVALVWFVYILLRIIGFLYM